MILVNKETLETCQPSELSELLPHVLFDFSEDGLAGSDYAILQMPDQPMFDSRYQTATVGTVIESDGTYSAPWVLVPKSEDVTVLAGLKIAEITSSCESAITAGFYSEALGNLNFYACDIPAQLNIQANLLAASVGRDVRHICTDPNGNREIRNHSVVQMIAVGDSMGLHIWDKLEKANDLRLMIAECVAENDIDSLISISW